MKKLILFLLPASLLFPALNAQTGYDIRIDFKGCSDTTVYLAKYFWDQMPIVDSCKHVRNGKITFKGSAPLDKGVYFLANQGRSSYYCQFIVDANQKFTISFNGTDVANTLKSEDKQNEFFFAYIKYMTARSKELNDYRLSVRGRKDSADAVNKKQTEISNQMLAYDRDFMSRTKGLFVNDLMNMKAEKTPTNVPLASNGRPDSVYQYYYYKNHYFDGINFKDDRSIHTPFFADKVKNYFSHMVIQHPDSVIRELDVLLGKCQPGTLLFNTLVGHFTMKYEQDKSMSFDQYGRSNSMEKVFIHLADKYIVSGKTDGYYSAETIVKIKERIEILKNLQPGVRVSDLLMIDTTYGKQVLKMGFDTVQSSQSVTYLYNKNAERLAPLYKKLYDQKGQYTVLVFWAADCSHCQTEVPKLHREMEKLRGKVDVSVYAVQTKEELLDTWKKFIIEKKLTGFTHVFDPIHLNNLKEQFDIVATPVIYLLDQDKRIIAKKLGPEQTREIIEKIEELRKEQKQNQKN